MLSNVLLVDAMHSLSTVVAIGQPETRPYNTVNGYFKDIDPARPVFKGGPGAWEAVLRYSYTDLNNKGVHGGIFG
jgi:phosphate-selective porin